jgi:hypothetical protein
MDVLSVGGKDYVKASVIARELGYTADYVGQLCRAHKVHAKLVGRSWYVDRSSIGAHKTNRYRSTQAKSIEHLKEEVSSSSETSVVPIRRSSVGGSNFYGHSVKKPEVSYDTDAAELIPVVKKERIELPVELADARALEIANKSHDYHFVTPKVPVIKFKGTLEVTSYGDEKTEVAADASSEDSPEHASESTEDTRTLHPTDTSRTPEKEQRKANNIVKSIHHVAVKPSKVVVETADAEETAPASTLIKKFALEADPEETTRVEVEDVATAPSHSLAIFASATALSVLVVLTVFGLEAEYVITSQTITTSYSFGFENLKLTASVYDSLDTMKGLLYLAEFSTNFLNF